MLELKLLSDALDQHVRPATFGVAVRMAKEGEPLPPRAKRPKQDLGIQVAICQTLSFARRYGWTLAVGREDLSCPLALNVFGFAPLLDYFAEGHACAGMYTQSPEAGARTEAETAKLRHGEYQHLLAAPLARATFEPQVIIQYATPAQVMRLVAAALWQRGGRIASSFSARIDCADGVIETWQKDDYNVVLPCYGDRIFGQAEEHEMAFAFPATKVEELIAGLEGTHKGGIRYPIPSFLRYTGQFPEQYNKMFELWEASEQTEGRETP